MIAAKHWRTHVGHWRLPRRPPRLSVQHTGVSPPEEIQVEKRRTMKFIEFRLSTFSPPQVFHFQCFRQNRRGGDLSNQSGKISVSGVTSISRDFRLVWHAALKEWLKIDGGSTSWRSFGEREEEERLIPGLLFFPPLCSSLFLSVSLSSCAESGSLWLSPRLFSNTPPTVSLGGVQLPG